MTIGVGPRTPLFAISHLVGEISPLLPARLSDKLYRPLAARDALSGSGRLPNRSHVPSAAMNVPAMTRLATTTRRARRARVSTAGIVARSSRTTTAAARTVRFALAPLHRNAGGCGCVELTPDQEAPGVSVRLAPLGVTGP